MAPEHPVVSLQLRRLYQIAVKNTAIEFGLLNISVT